MKKSHIILSIAVGLIIAVIFAWNIAYPSGTWRYKMTVSVETPEGIKAGSAVREVYARAGFRILGGTTSKVSVKGEAVVVDLGERGVLFALLSNAYGPDYGFRVVSQAFPVPGRHPGTGIKSAQGIRYYKSLKNEKVVLPISAYPTIVSFKDMNDPKSIEVILESVPAGMPVHSKFKIQTNRFEEFLGKGVRLKDITLEITEEPLTWGFIKTYLGPRHAVGPYQFIRGEQ
jgi:hypothetical protein